VSNESEASGVGLEASGVADEMNRLNSSLPGRPGRDVFVVPSSYDRRVERS
jgi:hypothetical protein